VGDFDNDGALDAIFTRLNDGPILLHNNAGKDNAWIGFDLQGTKSNRDAIGAKITVTAGTRKIVRWIVGGSSYLSSHDKRVIVGLGKEFPAQSVNAVINWPSGTTQQLSGLKLKQYHRIVEAPPASNSKSVLK